MARTIYDLAEQTESNTRRSAQSQEIMNLQMAALLSVNVSQLRVQQRQLDVSREHLQVGQQQLYVQDQIRRLQAQQLEVSQDQLVEAMKTVGRLDLANEKLSQIDASLADISGILVQQNALIHRSMNRLSNEAQELMTRAMEAYNNDWHADAIRDLCQALEKNPYATPAHYFLAKCYVRVDRPQDALQAYERCIFYGRKNAPLFHSLALCDLAAMALRDKKPAEARALLQKAGSCAEQDKIVLASALLECDLAEKKLGAETRAIVAATFQDENVDPEVLQEALDRKAKSADAPGLQKQLAEESSRWAELTKNALFQRLVSHFYREIDDFVYLAPRIRRGFMDAAGGKFLSLGDPLADVLDWTAGIGEELLKSIDLFPPDYPAILRFYRPLMAWNAMLVRLYKLTSLLDAKRNLVNGQFVEKLNLGLVELPRLYEDDVILFEVNTEEGDTLALSCYYAIFTRNGQDHFPVPLEELSLLSIDRFVLADGVKGVVVRHSRTGQTLIQGKTSFFRWEGSKEKHYFIDNFVEIAALLSEVHECIQWAIQREQELFSVFLLLHAVAEKLTGQRQALRQPTAQSVPLLAKAKGKADDDFEIVEEPASTPPAKAAVAAAPASLVADDDFEVVEEAAPRRWFVAKDRQRLGPFTHTQLEAMLKRGELNGKEMFLEEGASKWVQSTELPSLFARSVR